MKVSVYVREHGSRKFVLANPKAKYAYPNTIFVLRYKQDGKRVFETLGPNHNYSLALAKAKMREADLLRGNAPYTPSAPKPQPKIDGPVMLDAAIDRYLDNKRHKAKSTTQGYKWTLQQFFAAVGNKPVDTLTEQDLYNFIAAMQEERLSPRTQDNRITEVKTFLLTIKKVCPLALAIHNKEVRVSVKYTEPKVRAYRPDELKALFAASDENELLMWQFYLCTGAREQEVMNATYEDVDFIDCLFNVRQKPNWTPKDYEEREIPIPDFLVAALKGRNGTGLIFPTKDGKRDSHMLRRLKELAFRSGLNCGHCTGRLDSEEVSCANAPVCEKWKLHRFRKTYATLQHREGVDARTIQKRLGHSSLETTLAYLEGEEPRSERSRQQVNGTFGVFGKETNFLTQ